MLPAFWQNLPAKAGRNRFRAETSTPSQASAVSLGLERNPKLTPADIRRILTASARRLGTGERDDNFGAGLIDPLKALQLAEPRTAATTPPPAPPPTLRQR